MFNLYPITSRNEKLPQIHEGNIDKKDVHLPKFLIAHLTDLLAIK